MAYLTTRTQASSVACNDILHIVKTTDTSQNPAGSSYKATVGQLLSGCCVNDFYVKNIHGCNTGNLFVQPLDEGNIYFGENTAEDGFTIDLDIDAAGRTRLGLHTNTPQYTFDFFSNTGEGRFLWGDNYPVGNTFDSWLQVIHSGTTSNFIGTQMVVDGGDGLGTRSIGIFVRGISDGNSVAAEMCDPGECALVGSSRTINLNIVKRMDTQNTYTDNINFYAGVNVDETPIPHMTIRGRNGADGTETYQEGNVGINVLNPTEKLDVGGNLRVRTVLSASYSLSLGISSTGELRYQNTSDIRLKKDVSTIDSALSKVLNLRGVNFTWIGNEEVGNQIGFIAQEVEQVVPELTFEVPNPEEDYKGVHYESVSALLVEAVKELNEKTKLKEYTPTSISDPYGEKGDQVFDDNFMYIKTGAGWKKFPLMDI
jgi:hypothetical protein